MDSLLDELGGDSLGLNIVCDESKAQKKPTKPKKKNRYEKRRAQSRRAKEEKMMKKNQSNANDKPLTTKSQESTKTKVETKKDQVSDHDVNSSDTPSAPMQDISDLVFQSIQHDDKVTADNVTADTESSDLEQDDVKKLPQKKSREVKAKETNDESVEEKISKETSSKVNVPIPATSTTEASRKTQHSVTTQMLQDEAKRAEYLSTYHARPYEMDRRSGAASQIRESKDSTHIFEDDDDNMEDGSNDACPFTKYGIHQKIITAIKSEKFKLKRPTVIQRNAWGEMIKRKSSAARKNLFIQSETGSGKTLAYFLPMLQSLAIDPRTNKVKKVDRNLGGTRAVIICPTRELTTQTYSVAEKLCQHTFPWLVAGCLSGGEKRKSEKARLRKGVSILIATPGRLLDHLEKTDCLLMALKGKLEWIVLDESDRLLDMGLGNQIEQIVQIIRANQSGSGIKRDGITWQSMLVSATISSKIENLATKLLGGSKWVWARAKKNVGDEKLINDDESGSSQMELSSAAPKQLTQLHMVVSSKLRLTALVAFLTARVEKKERVVVFMSTCDGVDFHHKLFTEMNNILTGKDRDVDDSGGGAGQGIFGKACSVHRLHGNIPHRERISILGNFSKDTSKHASILLTTDVTARGLNLPGVDWIVQYDPPCETSDYIHRAGRAARAGKSGHALLFLLPSEVQYIEVLKLRGLPDVSALSLSTTLEIASKICPDLTTAGLKLTGQGHGPKHHINRTRVGEAFSSAVQVRLEECIVEDDKTYKTALAKTIENNKEASDKAQRKKERREAKNAVGQLLESARTAYFSYIRGYSTKEKAVRHIFNARSLHLGHVARSFALKEQPKELSRAYRKSRQEEKDVIKSTGRKRNSNLAFGDKKKNAQADVEEAAADAVSSVIGGALPPSKKGKKQKIISFDNNQSGAADSGPITKGSSNRAMKERMLAAAKKIQGGGMEFF